VQISDSHIGFNKQGVDTDVAGKLQPPQIGSLIAYLRTLK
jgi:hypothetical protein